jgi:AcrR family transcriptional regulator
MVQVLNRKSNGVSSGRVQRKNEARRLSILRAAARVFRRLGVSATGMREIAEEADLSPGNLYYYFNGKDEILLFCQERTLERLAAGVKAARAIPGAWAGRLRVVLGSHVHAMLDELEGATAHLEVEALPEDMRTAVVQKRDAYERAVRALVSEGIKAGEFSARDPALVTRAMLGAVNWTAMWYRSDGVQSVAEIADSLSDYLVGGLLARKGAR